MTDPFTDYVTVDDLRRMTNDDLDKYRTSSWASAIWSLPRADLEHLAEGHPDASADRSAWRQGLAGWLARGLLGDPGAGLDELARPRRRQHPSSRELTGRDLAARFLHPGLQRTLKTMLDELEERSDGTREGIARVTTAQYLKALQLFTYAARVPAGTILTQDDFASAASFLLARGDRFGATILTGFAWRVMDGRVGTAGNVLAAHQRWAARHGYWERLAAGAVSEPPHEPARPACRTAREDEVLARMLHDPADPAPGLVTGDMLTSHLRAELHAVLTLGDPGNARAAFAHVLARAPGWALRDLGWPGAPRALRYFDRLAATPVTAAQAHEAAHAVSEAAEQAANRHLLQAATARPVPRQRVPPPSARRTVTPRRPPLTPSPPLPAQAGPVPRPLSRTGGTHMTRHGTSRAQAVRRAHEAKSQRDAERRRHEEQIDAALADYYQAAAETDKIRDAARRKAEGITAAAEQAAGDSLAAARDAVRRLRDLLGGTAEVAALCGIPVTKVREYLAAVPGGRPGGGDDNAA